MRALAALAFVLVLGPAAAFADSTRPQGSREIARRPFGPGQLRLVVDAGGTGTLFYSQAGTPEQAVPCDRLTGAWGLWVGDLEGDGTPEAIITLRKPAKHDPVVENRLHVYAIEDGQCVPLWFERIAVSGDRVLALERTGAGRRVAWYRWHGFGYLLEETLWQGNGLPSGKLLAMFREGKNK
jgi:YD repeat-containing protein